MIKQTRASRWLQVLETAQVMLSQSLVSFYEHRSRNMALSVQAQNLIIEYSSEPIKLMTESDPPIEGTDLAVQLNEVIALARALRSGRNFDSGLIALVAAFDEVIPVLKATEEDEIESAETLLEELERGFMLSVILSMSAHDAIMKRVDEWAKLRHPFVMGKKTNDIGHYFSVHVTNLEEMKASRTGFGRPVESSFYSDEPGPGKIHMQHLTLAINSGANVMVYGGGGMRTTTYYPEAQGIEYAQWFTYMHALWDEQFRPRFAKFYNRGKDPADHLTKNDIKSDYFNDIRKIRTDFVHRQGIVEDAADLKFFDWGFDVGSRLEINMDQMIEVVDRFPGKKLLEVPSPHRQQRKSLHGSFDVDLLFKYNEHIDASPTLGLKRANDEMMHDWLVKKGIISSD